MRQIVKKEYNVSGITLVALVITIIILLILAGITISSLTGSGLFENAKLAEQKSKEAEEKEEGILEDYENTIKDTIFGSRNNTQEEIVKVIENKIKNMKLDYDNKVDIKTYNSSTNKYVVPSFGIISSYGQSLAADGVISVNVNDIMLAVAGGSKTAYTHASYSQIVTVGDNIYFSVPSTTKLECAYYIPFKFE